jgi:putative endonuclease
MTVARQRLGLKGEEIACVELERRGYSLLERRYRSRYGEIDIIAREEGTVAFVEVKTKTDGRFGDPAEMVDAQKQRRLVSMAEEYVARHALHDTRCRFDVVAIDASSDPPAITVYKDAFRPGW